MVGSEEGREHDAIEKAEIDRRNDEDAVVAYNKALIDRSTAELAWRKARYDLEIIEERKDARRRPPRRPLN